MDLTLLSERYGFRWLGAVCLWLLLTTASAQNIRYVRPYAYASNSNPASATSWLTATEDLQGAINSLSATGGQVWVASGTHYPGGFFNTNRGVSFSLCNGVEVYGGFNNESLSLTPSLADRQPAVFITTLSGQLPNTTSGSNSFHVLENTDLNSTALLDGFVITAGTANGTGTGRFGGGMYNVRSSPTIQNCVFRQNTASSGGGVNNDDKSSPQLVNCAFEFNRATSVGGGVANTTSSPVLTNCSFLSNTANSGGGLANNSNNPGISTQLNNCSFQGNVATTSGGAIANGVSSTVVMSNGVVWGNGGLDSFSNSHTLTATYSLLEEGIIGYGGANNLITKPTPFASPTSVGLNGCSIGIDAANPASTTVGSPGTPAAPYSATALPTTDLLGNLRRSNGGIDVGAIEYQGPPLVITSQPTGTIAACVGTTLTLPASASGAGPITYQWFRNGTAVPGATSATLSLPNAQSSVSGTYSLSVTGACLSLTTTPVAVLVNPFSRLFVKPGGTGNGGSWNTALGDVQTSINASCPNGQVWVAAGTYRPTGSNDRTASFSLRNQVSVLGGFAGTETLLSQRPTISPTTGQPSSSTLSGEIGDPNTLTDNSTNVVQNTTNTLTNSAILDGFVIKGGYGGGGAGMLNISGNPVVLNCLFADNTGSTGGGMLNINASPTLTGCVFRANRTMSVGFGGGGIYNDFGSSPVLTNCSFLSNVVPNGGGGAMFSIANSNPRCINCLVQDNVASTGGGFYALQSTMQLVNSVFINNQATNGGAIINLQSNCQLLNCSFQGNQATLGGCLSTYNSSQIQAHNCIFWNNVSTLFSPIYSDLSSASIVSSYCLLDPLTEGLTDPTNLTITGSPFSNTSSAALSAYSPAINAGNPASVTVANGGVPPSPYSALNLPTIDFAGNPRIIGGQVDIGAVEYPQVVLFSVKVGDWNDPSVWSLNRVPTATDPVELRHMVSLPASYSAQVSSLRYRLSGQLRTNAGSLMRVGF